MRPLARAALAALALVCLGVVLATTDHPSLAETQRTALAVGLVAGCLASWATDASREDS